MLGLNTSILTASLSKIGSKKNGTVRKMEIFAANINR